MNEKTYEMAQDAIDRELVSDCCGAPIVMGDICMECREHCSHQENE